VTPEQAAESTRSRRFWPYWAAALALLIAVGLVCWLVVVPVRRMNRQLEAYDKATNLVAEREKIIAELGGPAKAVRAFRLYLACPQWAAPWRPWVPSVLKECGEPAIRELASQLGHHSDPEVRWRSAYALKVLRERGTDTTAAVPALTAALDDPEEMARSSAATALFAMGPAAKSVMPRVRKTWQELSNSRDPGIRRTAIQQLARIERAQKKDAAE